MLEEQLTQLTTENTQLAAQIEQYHLDTRQLQQQLQVLQNLPEDFSTQNIYNLQQVNIHRYSNIIDDDEDGRKESLVVYIQPIDADGDKIKAAGQVDVQLWDLNNPQDQALLGQWHIDWPQLQKLWNEFLVINYRLTFDVSDIVPTYDRELTLKVTFTDYLTGKIFNNQRVIKP